MDGAGSFARNANAPHVHSFAERGLLTYEAQAVVPTISAECWGSILHGVKPEAHGLTNERADKSSFPDDSHHPSVFRLARERWPHAKLASFTAWSPINRGIIEDGAGVYKVSLPDEPLTSAVLDYLTDNPDVKLLFLQLDEPDGAGHRSGYGADSPEYLQAIEQSDRLIGTILAKIEELGLAGDSLVMVVTDHGGGGISRNDHGSDHPQDKTVFWGCSGPGIEPGTAVPEMTITDIAAIVAYALDFDAPAHWDAKLPASIFGHGR
nr:alkaline phosphatase family protein [Paenibacillus soyae]